jgi:hypothetical protein
MTIIIQKDRDTLILADEIVDSTLFEADLKDFYSNREPYLTYDVKVGIRTFTRFIPRKILEENYVTIE